ncbi:MAG: ABC transporter ATP-binding protein [Heliobacteriaceae bacterium]|nr:ABC transporter ATP-binding protein [Heliobacteriaceae bacterium]
MLKLIRFLKPFAKSAALVLVLMFLHSLAQLYLPTLMAAIVDTGIINGDIPYILKIGTFMLLVAAAGVACNVGASYLSAKTATGFGRNLRQTVFSQTTHFSLSEFNQFGTASLITRTTNDITQLQQVLLIGLRMMVNAPMMCIGGIIMAVSMDAALSQIILVVVPILAAVIAIVALKALPLFRAMQEKLDQLNLVLRENLTGIRVIRAFNREEYEKQRFDTANYDLTGTAIKVNRIMAALMPVMMLVMNFTTIAIIWFGGIRIDQGNMQVGALMAFIQYMMQIMFSLFMFSMLFVMLPRAAASATRINAVLDVEPEIKDPENPKPATGEKGVVEFRQVTFSYPEAEQPALRDISFKAGPGEVTAIIGGTGSGKSTLVNLLLRFYDVDQGGIFVDGRDVREISQADLRAKIGFVPQKAILFTGTIADNIRFGKESATDKAVWSACETAQATEFIRGMKDGLAAVIAQGGANVSGGQKQRLAIARALIRKPGIYVFDDSFSALDYKTDAHLRAALKKEIAAATVLIVAQRVTTVMTADRIIVLDDGKIAGMGTHRELLTTCAVYREIVASQLAGEVTA